MRRLLLSISATLSLAACADSISTPRSLRPSSIAKYEEGESRCEVITFTGLSHGTVVTDQVSVLGSQLQFSAVAHTNPAGTTASEARIYDSEHSGGPDPDLESPDASGICAACTLGSMLIVQDPANTETATAPYGGRIGITGFPGGAYIKSFTLIDMDKPEEPDVLLIVDGQNIASSAQGGVSHGAQTIGITEIRPITSDGVEFVFGSQATGVNPGSMAVDNITVCVPELGREGCGRSFWKKDVSTWYITGFGPTTLLRQVFKNATMIDESFANTTLFDAVSFGGGQGLVGSAQLLARAAVVALLNAGHPDVAYPRSVADITSAVDIAFASGDGNAMRDLTRDLEAANNLGCPLKK
jgi:hypothetical protein